MTRQQYQQKYGTAPGVSQPSSTVTSQPIKMTRAEYEQKYNTSVAQPKQPGIVGSVIKSITSPFINTAKNVGAAGFEVARAIPTALKKNDNRKYSLYVNPDTGKEIDNPFVSDQELTKLSQPLSLDKGSALRQQVSDSANIAAWAVPVGKGATVTSKFIAPGAGIGALTSLNPNVNMNELPEEIAKGAAGGVASAGLLFGAGKVAKPVFNRFSKSLSSFSDTLGAKAQKFNKTDIKAIREATGTDPLTFARREGLPIAATKKSVNITEKAMQVLQDQYNAMVRTGNKVSRKDYAQAIKNQADELLAKADTPEIRALAKQLYEEAQYQLRQKSKFMTDEFLTDTKTAAFTGASKNQISNPLISGREEQLGRAGVETLESYAPGSKDLGKSLRGYRTYLEKLDSQANTGKGTQLFNILKPAGAGLLAGAGAGSFIPGIGNIGGAIAGGAIATVINSPRFLAKASDVLYNASKAGGKSIGLTTAQKGVLLKMYNAGRAGRVFNPSDQESPIVEKILLMPEFQEEIPYQDYTPKSDLLDEIAKKQGLDVNEMRKKRLNFRR